MSERASQDDDELPSLLRRSTLNPTYRDYDHDIRFQNRNSEDVHRDALAAAQVEHDRVREIALKAYELNELRKDQLRLRQSAQREEERVRLETARALEEIRIREIENRAKRIPKPPPREPTPPPPSPPRSLPSKVTPPTSAQPPATVPQPEPQVKQQPPPEPVSREAPTQKPFLAAPQPPVQAPAPPVPKPQAAPVQPPTQIPPQIPTTSAPAQPHVLPGVERYIEIHKNLKQLRLFITNAGKHNVAFKKKTGEMRRAIRQSVGQLTEGKGANKQPLNKIVELLRQSLTTVQSPPADPSMVMLTKPEPSEGAKYNGDSMPALFIYLLNVFAKSVVAQFIDEAGVAPKAADPVGVVAVSVFSREEFYWRNTPLIDILIAKIRVVCPVLFGLRGSEKTEEGRARLGWRKEGGSWVTDQIHNTRMTGLGAGYAALCLRDFSKSKLQNPWPPTHYWQTVASIVSTPPDQASPTQYMVLKSLIENYEMKFLAFYGSAARAALRIALVEFPARAIEHNVAVSSLKVLGDKLNRDMGLQLQ
ncbi:Uncharacterized protein BP5553_09448 [Venustampulla echinocandica]|uniref:mRNA export factor GLE1 n=1 Tax=Venustampulla echinocandica TaxID=2656787 RepID=A0A370TCT7_9HELO|nr:Uncharacterized protein BP5553_09448 [Venustampulla echinocandica]RDL32046.1 Uncharacterized protein BP5553_09448 [Venustampulla echinocandica]